MTQIVFIANAIVTLTIAGLCLYHAYPRRERFLFFGATTIYGVLLEQFVILRFDVYRYPIEEYLLTVGDVPIVIAIAWAAIIYSGFHAARRLGFPQSAVPFFVGLYALHIDFAIDPIAIRIPFWMWAFSGEWFNVPLGNFFGWYLVATLFTTFWVSLDSKVASRLLLSVISVFSSLGSLLLLLWVYVTVAKIPFSQVAILGVALLGSGLIITRERLRVRRIPVVLALVPTLLIGFYLGVFLWHGTYVQQPLLMLVVLAMMGIWLLTYAFSAMRDKSISEKGPRRSTHVFQRSL